jgi:uncharacterized 2Fe-2S/4Fe-4S cluster protein (DUF4445 family)
MSEPEKRTVTVKPIGAVIRAPEGALLRDILFEYGVEFPCGGQGRCRGCRVQVQEGRAALNAAQTERLSAAEIESGWRLACQCRVEDDLVIEIRQWDAAILADETAVPFTPQEGLGVAVDLGTTTLVAQLLDLQTGYTLAVRTALNAQARYGADVMSRIQFAVTDSSQHVLEQTIRVQIGSLIHQLLEAARQDPGRLRRVTLVGNTVMHHLFSGIDVTPLSAVPFETEHGGLQTLSPQQLGWPLSNDTIVHFLPTMGSFVGSDLLAGVIATRMFESENISVLVDLGTNGEIVLGGRDRILCASTAAGPAFEGARISMGMRASTGAIWKVMAADGEFACEVLGNAEPRGICGSGLVDAVAAGLELGRIGLTGRLSGGAPSLDIAPPVNITQTDVRQLQLAKGAIAAALRILLRKWRATPDDVSVIHLAGAFGNYVDRASARRIGLFDFPPDKVQAVGNTALRGARLALFTPEEEERSGDAILRVVEHVALHADPDFQDIYVEEMGFPSCG